MASQLTHLKARCAGCQRQGVQMSKEHLFPQWLILRTGTQKTGIRWGKKPGVPALAATFPLCVECNAAFGRDLEGPTCRLFEDIERNRGLNDEEAELLVRWMWKIKGLAWMAAHPDGQYSSKYALRERVLLPIDEIRGRLVLGLALIDRQHPDSTDLPMGVDSVTEHDAIFVSGVFSRIAMMVVLDQFEAMMPLQFERYHLAQKRNPLNAVKVYYPRRSFRDDVEAVGVTTMASLPLSIAHDRLALEFQGAG